ncbi:MAG: tRNA (adenosine(37)-N6)-threonylcarbamoyltransferase complex ATPase subunit type 1 TsaE [Flavobacteriales bacterium]
MEFAAHNPDELQEIAKSFLARFPLPGVYILNGEMGAGKTTFIRTICKELGVQDASSPTYSLVNEYRTSDGKCIYHFDLYRIKSLEEALDFGFEEYLDQHAYVFIEWPEKILSLLDGHHSISIDVRGDSRIIAF